MKTENEQLIYHNSFHFLGPLFFPPQKFVVFLETSCTPCSLVIPDIVGVSCYMTLGPSVKLQVVPLAGGSNALDLTP